ncbi:MAG: double-strand break repair helicase AddA [Pseudomonadota bacterium]
MSAIIRPVARRGGDGPTTFRSHDPATLAQTRAARPEASVWVSANAGSGKTRVLTNRVARLLLAGAAPQRILCLTYTKAAAAEMQNRLFKTLGAWAMADDERLAAEIDRLLPNDEPPLAPDALETARRLFARALETPGGLKIQTIHAFCESLLSRFPLEAGVSPHFQVIDENAAEELLQSAQDQTALDSAGEPALAEAFERVLSSAGEATLQELFAEVLSQRAAFLRGGSPEGRTDPGPAIAKALGAEEGASAESVLARWRAHADWPMIARLAVAFERADGKRDQERGARLRAALTAAGDGEKLALVRAALLVKDELRPPEKGLPSKSFQTEHPWADEPIHQLQQNAIAATRAAAVAERWEASTALARISRALLTRYQALKAARAGLDYDDLIERAVGLLTRAEARDWVRFKLDGGVEHILVDEAQDTSPAQWRVIGALAEEFFAGRTAYSERAGEERPRTLFAVGDEKQSIYSFQGAAPALLAETGRAFRARAAAADRAFEQADMETSFRSTPAILEFVDRVFAPEEARAGLLFGDRTAVAHRAFRAGQPGRVELWPLVTPRDAGPAPAWDEPIDAPPADDPARRLAGLVARQIADWVGTEPLPARGRKMRAGDVLVLVRKRGPLSVGIIKRLKQLGVPVSGEDRLLLAGQLAVKDLLALGRFCLFPEDDLTLATVLRSPFCDVSEEQLFELAHERPGRRPLWYALKERATERPAETPAFTRAAALLQGLIDRADFLRPFELYAHALSHDAGQGSGRARLLGRLGAEAEDPIDEFLAQALSFETATTPTLQGFVSWMTTREAEIKREHEQGRDEVRVMTAHGAKGLEAPVVVLPDTTGAPGGGRAPKLLDPATVDPDSASPPIWIGRKESDPPAVAALRAAREAREAEEHRRLLYVALTRAEDRLLIAGSLGKRRESPEGSWYALCAAAMAGAEPVRSPVTDAEGRALDALRKDGVGTAKTREDDVAARGAMALPVEAWMRRAAPLETAPSDLSPSKLGGEDPETELEIIARGSGLESGAAAARGELIHLLLETLAEAPSERRRGRGASLLERQASGFDAATRAEMLEEALAVFEMPEASLLFGPGSRAEVPVGAVLPSLGPGELHGVVDRLVVGPERVLIVDFKSGRAPAAAPEAYLRQLAAYREALRPLFEDRPIDCALLWTALPRLEPVSSDVLDGAIDRASRDLERST